MVSVEEPAQAWGQTTTRQTARTAQAQRGRRPRDRIGDAGLTCCGGRKRCQCSWDQAVRARSPTRSSHLVARCRGQVPGSGVGVFVVRGQWVSVGGVFG